MPAVSQYVPAAGVVVPSGAGPTDTVTCSKNAIVSVPLDVTDSEPPTIGRLDATEATG